VVVRKDGRRETPDQLPIEASDRDKIAHGHAERVLKL